MESPHDGRQYVFELNDRLIRDKELDGLTEIPLKPSPGVQQMKPVSDEDNIQSDEQEEFVPSTFHGYLCLFCIIWRHAWKFVMPFFYVSFLPNN